MWRQTQAELSSNPFHYELERLNKETDQRSKLRPSGETKRILLPSSRVAQRKINDGQKPVQEKACGITKINASMQLPRRRWNLHSITRFASLNSSLCQLHSAMFSMFSAVCVFTYVLCESMLKTLRTMFDLSVGGPTKYVDANSLNFITHNFKCCSLLF